jgi:Domain of Unknown Function (DUF928)
MTYTQSDPHLYPVPGSTTQRNRNRIARLLTNALAGASLALCLIPLTAHADDDRAPSSGRSSGSRGCGVATMPAQPSGTPALILLAPSKQPGQTTSTRPTFAWFVRDPDPVPLEFRIYEQDNHHFNLVQEIKGDRLKSTPGIMVLAPNPNTPELTPGKRYRWQVELICNANRPAGNPLAEAELEVVPLQGTLKQQLQQTRDPSHQAKLYDQANLWYDLVSAVLDPFSNFTTAKQLQSSLFNRIALNPTEQTLLQNSTIRSVQQ